VHRRDLLVAAAASLAGPINAQTGAALREVADGVGRRLRVPATVRRVFPAGPPAAIWLYTLAPDLLIGWPRANRAAEKEFLLPGVGDRPEVGRITGRGNSANLEQVLSTQPDLIVDAGSTRQTFVELAERVQAQTGIPYALLDGRLDRVVEGYELLGAMTGRSERAGRLAAYARQTLDEVRRRLPASGQPAGPRVYYARGPAGLETGLGGSINVEIMEFMGLRNVAASLSGGLANVSMEQVLTWDPEVIITIDQSFAETVRSNPLWRNVSAVRSGRVHLSPKLPFGWVDFPPSVNRLPGLWWLGSKVYPERFPEDMGDLVRDFYRLFYQVDLRPDQVARVLAGRS
jgi:iron complex transport system substrate-binding protein